MAVLFEYGEWITIKHEDALCQLLKDIWQQRVSMECDEEVKEESNNKNYQPFLSFKNHQVRANKYVGFIQNNEDLVEIYPKVFRNSPIAIDNKELMLRHIFFWFKYCRKWRFPFNQATLDTTDIVEFPELIINLIASQFLDALSKKPLTIFQEIEETLNTPRGSIDFKQYINNGLSYGNYHNIDCIYEPFMFDNKINRIIKYCSRLLLHQTNFYENQRILQEVIFILDEVDDIPFTFFDVERITINPFFEEYSLLMDSCKLILNQQLYSQKTYDLTQWCLLFPMEYIFEDFIAGFVETNFFKDWKVEYQKSEKYLATTADGKNVFKMQHDIFLTSKELPDLKVIIDAKYKLRDHTFKEDTKRGIDQSDIYQMVSYAFKRGCRDIILLYPNLSESKPPPDRFKIESGFSNTEVIDLTALEIPFWSFTDFDNLENDLHHVLSETLKYIKTFHQTRLVN